MFDPEDLKTIARMPMPFGRYAGTLIGDLPESYLLWFEKKGFPAGRLGQLMQLALLLNVNGLQYLLDPLRDGRRVTPPPKKTNIRFEE